MDVRVKICLLQYGEVFVKTRRSIDALLASDIPCVLAEARHTVYPDSARNGMAAASVCDKRHQYADGKYTYFLFVDRDMVFTAEDIKRLISHEKGIVSALYDSRRITGKSCAGYWGERTGLISIDNHLSPRDTGMKSVDWCGGGLLLVKREVFEDENFLYPWFVRLPITWVDKDGNECEISTGEDIGFCMKAKDAGHEIFVDCDCKAGHLMTGSDGLYLSISDVTMDGFAEAFMRLYKRTDLFNIGTARKLTDSQEAIANEVRKARMLQEAFSVKHGGTALPDGTGVHIPLDSMTPEQVTAFENDMTDLHNHAFQIALDKKIVVPENVTGFSAHDIRCLNKLIHIAEEVENG